MQNIAFSLMPNNHFRLTIGKTALLRLKKDNTYAPYQKMCAKYGFFVAFLRLPFHAFLNNVLYCIVLLPPNMYCKTRFFFIIILYGCNLNLTLIF